MLTANELSKYLFYNTSTGEFLWTKSPAIRIKAGQSAGRICHNGYREIGFKKKLYRAHRLAWLLSYGEWPNEEVDHINGNRADNSLSNLRSVTRRENCKNIKLKPGHASGVIGVRFHAQRDKWQAQITVDGKNFHLGYFHTKEPAILARKAAEEKYGFHPNHGLMKAAG